MPEFLGTTGAGSIVTTEDDFTPALTLGPATSVAQINLSVLSANPVLLRCWRYAEPDDRQVPVLELVERLIPGQSIGLVITLAAGLQIRSGILGQPSYVKGSLYFDGEQENDEPGVPIAATKISPLGRSGL